MYWQNTLFINKLRLPIKKLLPFFNLFVCSTVLQLRFDGTVSVPTS